MDSKTLRETLAVTFGMFSALPVPKTEWNEKNMRYILCFFPLVGLAQGAIVSLWLLLCALTKMPGLVPAAGLCLLPVLVTGGLHLDGFVDTSDAMASHAGPQRRQEILHDSHTGAFGVIRTCAYFVAYFALCTALPVGPRTALLLTLAYVMERAYSGGCAARMAIAPGSGLTKMFARRADRKVVHQVCSAVIYSVAALLVLAGFLCGALMLAAQLAVMEYFKRMAERDFGGLSGDLQGWVLQVSELCMLAAMVLGLVLEGLL